MPRFAYLLPICTPLVSGRSLLTVCALGPAPQNGQSPFSSAGPCTSRSQPQSWQVMTFSVGAIG